VIAFSNAKGVMETGLITPNEYGIRRLLDFLSNSFVGGGTDVTGALKHAMQTLNTTDYGLVLAADLLLITDGEIPDPPVSEKIMSDLYILRRRFGIQIHGLLIGKEESVPLSKLCSKVHTFLSNYDTDTMLKVKAITKKVDNNGGTTFDDKSSVQPSNRLRYDSLQYKPYISSTTQLYSKMSGEFGFVHKNVWKRKRKFLLPIIDKWNRHTSHYDYNSKRIFLKNSFYIDEDDSTTNMMTFNDKVEDAVLKLQNEVDQRRISDMTSAADELDKERLDMGLCWRNNIDLKAAIDIVRKGLIERDEEAMLVVLGMITREHVILLGPPGTAKSALGRRLSLLCGGFFFQRLLTKFTTPEEIFGPLSLRSLENDEYRRCTEGYLPTASIAFLDEIFKANSAILNTLLTILNERKFDNGAGVRQLCPIQCVVGASNELPESEDLDALYDRFLIRKEVQPVSDDGIMQLLSSTLINKPQDDDIYIFQEGLDNVIEAVNVAADTVVLGFDVCSLIRDLRTFMKDEFDVRISDRRLVKAASLLKIIAATNGRSSVDLLDCLLLEHIVWQRPEQKKAIHEWLWMNLTPHGGSHNKIPSLSTSDVEPFRIILNGLYDEAMTTVRKTSGDISGTLGGRPQDILYIQSLTKEITNISELMLNRINILARHIEVVRRSDDHIWLTADTAIAAQQQLIPKANQILMEMKKLHSQSTCLAYVLSDQDTPIESSMRLSILEYMYGDIDLSSSKYQFTEDDFTIGMKEAKSRYDIETFRAWKRARKKKMN
jgi:MoxR-like ATPase